ncbi:MAG: phosphodiesterase [Bacteroidetes bacterium]|nr:MAG: phosphodiesterase [Bacteroidota bacterium]
MKKLLMIFSFSPFLLSSFAQVPSHKIIAGPLLGQVELRTAAIWIQVDSSVRKLAIKYWKHNDKDRSVTQAFNGELGMEFNPVTFQVGGLDMNTQYDYDFIVDEKTSGNIASFKTKDLWQWRKPAPDFSFLTGSCAYFNEPAFDRPGKPYGGDSTIFETMAKFPAAFMLWLGDNWYTREPDFLSGWGLWYRASRDRSLPVLRNFLKSMPQYAIWDDHDFGPDDSDGSYHLKDISRKIFMSYWPNPSYGENGKGIYTKVSYGDVDLFLTDDRYFRSANDLRDSIDGKPNPNKHFFGRTQLDWLKNALAYSEAPFKLIAIGSQVLNPIHKEFESLNRFSAEYTELMDFLNAQRIDGVIFLTGDRHHSEVIKADRPGNYALYDITSSPLTSGVSKVSGIEVQNPARVPGTLVEERNFTRITVSGNKGERKIQVEFIGLHGATLANWSVNERELKH